MFFPGTPPHQNILKAIAHHYQHDPRIRAVTVFGSLARGNWDQHSDLDLDIIVRDDMLLDPVNEAKGLERVLNSIGEKLSFVIPDGEEAVDIVLETLTEISIRYHHLRTTKHVIIENMISIAGDLDLETIRQAGLANLPEKNSSPKMALDRCFRYAIEINAAIERQRLWMGVELLHRTRNLLMEIYSLTREGGRFTQHFDNSASQELSDLLFSTLPTANTLPQAFENILNILQNEIPRFSNGKLHLQSHHRIIIEKLRKVTL